MSINIWNCIENIVSIFFILYRRTGTNNNSNCKYKNPSNNSYIFGIYPKYILYLSLIKYVWFTDYWLCGTTGAIRPMVAITDKITDRKADGVPGLFAKCSAAIRRSENMSLVCGLRWDAYRNVRKW